MNYIRPLVLATACIFLGSAAWAADQEDHEAHHPEGPASSVKAPKNAVANKAATKESMAMMDKQMKVMQEMHEKMMNAKTPEERNALMADHMKAMQGGMSMMGSMGGMGKDAKAGMQGSMPSDMATRQQMMEKRMDMMQSMMQMMMDRMPAVPAK